MIEKTYSIGETAKAVLKSPGFWGVAAPMAAVGAVNAGAMGVGRIMETKNKALAYKEMLDTNPALKRHKATKTQAYFNSMYRVSPELAKDPYVSGAWVQNVLDNEDPHDNRPNYTLLSAVQDLAGPGKSLVDARSRRSDSGQALASTLSDAAGRSGSAFVDEFHKMRDTSREAIGRRKGFDEGFGYVRDKARGGVAPEKIMKPWKE